MNKSSPKVKHYKPQVTSNPQAILLSFSSFSVLDKTVSNKDLYTICKIYNKPVYRHRFAYIPMTVNEVRKILQNKANHILAARKNEIIIAVLLLYDEKPPIQRSWIETFVVDSTYHGKTIGTQLLQYALWYAFTHKNSYGNWRENIHFSIIQNKGSEAVEQMMLINGFEFRIRWWKSFGYQKQNNSLKQFTTQYYHQEREDVHRYEIRFPVWLQASSGGMYKHLNRWNIKEELIMLYTALLKGMY